MLLVGHTLSVILGMGGLNCAVLLDVTLLADNELCTIVFGRGEYGNALLF